MEEQGYQPSGYCPVCGYAMDAGRCPECGISVPPERLERDSGAVIRKRRLKRIRRVLLAVAILCAGWYAYHTRVAWIPRLPTAILLLIQGDSNSLATCELWDRLGNQQLTTEQVVALLDKAIQPQDPFRTYNPHPAGEQIRVELPVRTSVPPLSVPQQFSGKTRGWLAYVGGSAVVDGRQVSVAAGGGTALGYRSSRSFTAWLPALDAGEHNISVNLVLEFQATQNGPPAAPQMTLTFANQKITCQDRPPGDFVTRVWDPDLAKDVQANVYLSAEHSASGTGEPFIDIGMQLRPGVRTGIAGLVWIRLPGADPYEPTSGIIHYLPEDGASFSLSIKLCDALQPEPSDGGSAYGTWRHGRINRYPGVTSAQQINVRLVPDVGEAFRRGMTKCFDGVIEWQNVPIQPAGSRSPTFDDAVPPKGFAAATAVYHFVDEETGGSLGGRDDSKATATRELWKQFAGGQLSSEEAAALCAGIIQPLEPLGIRDPYPAGETVRVVGAVRINSPPGATGGGWWWEAVDGSAVVDGSPSRFRWGAEVEWAAGSPIISGATCPDWPPASTISA